MNKPPTSVGRRISSAAPLLTATTTTAAAATDEETAPLVRAMEIAEIFSSEVLGPVVKSLLNEGFPSDWNSFWAASSIDGVTNGQRVTMAMEKLGPTYVKFGQALGSRPDIVPVSLAEPLAVLQDDMKPFDSDTAREIIAKELDGVLDGDDLKSFVSSLSSEPVAAASVGQVYSGMLPNYGKVAVKVQRPGIRQLVKRDAELLKTVAILLESIPPLPNQKLNGQNRLIATELLFAVEEFMARIFEELDYRNEAANAAKFASLYGEDVSSDDTCVVVPDIREDLCTDNVLIMEWIEGTKLTDVDEGDQEALEENIRIIEKGIECTLNQLLVTGVIHADPHGGNLLKVSSEDGGKLGYLDFGMLATIPQQVRDGLVCSVSHLVFAQDTDAVASLFAELQLLPEEVINDPVERAELTKFLDITFSESLIYEKVADTNGDETVIPVLKFDKLLDALVRLVPRFQFKLPPYFINNARAMSTLEGIARSLDPSFNVFQGMCMFYSYFTDCPISLFAHTLRTNFLDSLYTCAGSHVSVCPEYIANQPRKVGRH